MFILIYLFDTWKCGLQIYDKIYLIFKNVCVNWIYVKGSEKKQMLEKEHIKESTAGIVYYELTIQKNMYWKCCSYFNFIYSNQLN